MISKAKIRRLYVMFEAGYRITKSANEVGINRKTSRRYYRLWIDEQLQKAYDALWDGDDKLCDAVNFYLPDTSVREMLDAWLDDQTEDNQPKSKWH